MNLDIRWGLKIPPLRLARSRLALLSEPVSNSVVVDSSDPSPDWTPSATNILPASSWPLSFPVGTNALQFYRARFEPWPAFNCTNLCDEVNLPSSASHRLLRLRQ